VEVTLEKERKKLLEAAVAEFSKHGLKGASLDSIAERAELDPSVARALFVDKERLFRTVMRESTEPLLAAIGLAVESIRDPRELIRQSLRHLDQWLLENEEYVRIIQWSALEEAKSIGRLYEQSFFPSEFYERIEWYIEAGELRVKDPFTVFLLLDSLIFFSHLVRPSLELMSGDDVENVFERRFEAIMDLLENGLYRG
jgi:TetR/AcrR family transcriptional regulator